MKRSEKDYNERKRQLLLRVSNKSDENLTSEEIAILEDDDEEDIVIDNHITNDNISDNNNDNNNNMSTLDNPDIKSHVNIPSQEDINKVIMEQKKKILMEKLESL